MWFAVARLVDLWFNINQNLCWQKGSDYNTFGALWTNRDLQPCILKKSHYSSSVPLLELLWNDKIIRPVKMEKLLLLCMMWNIDFFMNHMTMVSFKLYVRSMTLDVFFLFPHTQQKCLFFRIYVSELNKKGKRFRCHLCFFLENNVTFMLCAEKVFSLNIFWQICMI